MHKVSIIPSLYGWILSVMDITFYDKASSLPYTGVHGEVTKPIIM